MHSVTLWDKRYHCSITALRNHGDSVQTNIITNETDIRNIFESASSRLHWKSILSLLWLVTRHNWFERRLKLSTISSRFLENVFHQAGFIVQIHKTTWLWKFLVINNFRVLCLAFSFSSFENSKSYLSVTASSTSHSRKLERSYVEISSDALENLLNLQESIDCIIAMKSVSCTKIRISH